MTHRVLTNIDGQLVPILRGDDQMPDDGTGICVWDDDPTIGSLWVDWAHHGPISLLEGSSDD